MTQCERVREIRKYHDLTLEKFGNKLGVGKTAISNIENGNRNLTDQMILSICREFDVSEEWLRSGNGEMFERLTDQQKVMKYAGLLLKDTDSVVASAIKTFLVTYGQLDDTSKAVLNKIVLQYMENWKRIQ